MTTVPLPSVAAPPSNGARNGTITHVACAATESGRGAIHAILVPFAARLHPCSASNG